MDFRGSRISTASSSIPTQKTISYVTKRVVVIAQSHKMVEECKFYLKPHVVLQYRGEVVHLLCLVQGCRVEACLFDAAHTVEGGGMGNSVGKRVGSLWGRVSCSVSQILL